MGEVFALGKTQETRSSREQVRQVKMLSRFKLRIYYDIGRLFIMYKGRAQTKTTRRGRQDISTKEERNGT